MSGHLYKNTAILSLTLVLSRLLSFIFSGTDGTIRGMAYYRETTLKKAQATKKWLERKWEKAEKKSKVKTKRRKK